MGHSTVDAQYNALTVKGSTHRLTNHQVELLKEIVTGTLRAASRQDDKILIRDLGEILVMFQ